MKIEFKNKRNKRLCILLILVIVLISVFFINKNFRTESPFEIFNITVTSTGNGNYVDDNLDENWNLKLYQNNDIFISFGLKENMEKVEKKNARLKQAYIDNIKTVERPFREGKIEAYKLDGNENILFNYLPINKIEEKLEFNIVEANANTYKLELNKNGGQVALSVINNEIKEQIYEKREELAFDGTLFNEADIPLEELKFRISFDLNIVTEAGKKYTKTIELDLPQGNIVENGFEINENIEILNNQFEHSR